MIKNIKDYKYVDLGLPSGTLWCDRNLGASGESDYGNYYQWGNVEKIENTSNISESQYYEGIPATAQTPVIPATQGSELNHNIIPGSKYDAATQELNALWEMPTKDQFEELINTDYVDLNWTKNYNYTGIKGLLIKSRKNDNSIFLPVTGFIGKENDDNNEDDNDEDDIIAIGSYWSSSIDLKKEDTNGKRPYAINLYFEYDYSKPDDFNVFQNSYDRWHSYCIRPVRRRKSIFVDLGLPSGTLWCDRNVGAGNEYNYGNYYQWGNVENIKNASNISESQYYEGISETDQTPAIPATPGGKLQEDITPGGEYDAAMIELGDFWQMPTKDQFKELIDDNYVKKEYIEDYKNKRIKGLLITSKINTNKIFLPAAGHIIEGDNNQITLNSENKLGAYWSSSLNLDLENKKSAINFSFEINKQIGVNYNQDNENRWHGYSIRPVKKEQIEYVDLGLPSGTLWAKTNLGAKNEYDFGDYYQWGNVKKIEDASNISKDQYINNIGDFTNINHELYNKSIESNSDYNIASITLGCPWQIPSKGQFEELTNTEFVNVIWENKKVNEEDTVGINGLRITSKINNNSIFLPAAGLIVNRKNENNENNSFKLVNNNEYGSYWTGEIDSGYDNTRDSVNTSTLNYEYAHIKNNFAVNLYFRLNLNTENPNNLDDFVINNDDGKPIYRSIVSDRGYESDDVRWSGYSIRPVKVKQISFVDLGLPSGTLWCDRNLETVSPLIYGNLYQWANKEGYDYYNYDLLDEEFNKTQYSNTYGANLNTDIIQGGPYDTATNNNSELCMPTEFQFKELINDNYVRKEFKINYGCKDMNGLLITSRINGNSIFLPAAGYIHYNDTNGKWKPYDRGYVGSYWNTYKHMTKPDVASNLCFNEDDSGVDANTEGQNDRRWAGYSIRPIKRYKYNNISNISYNSSINNINELSEATYNVIENNIYNKLEKEIKNIELDKNLYKILLNNKNFNIKNINTIYDEKTPENLNDDTNINYIILQRLMKNNYESSNVGKCSNSLIVYKYKFIKFDKNYVGINIYYCDDNGICIPVVQTTYSSGS